MRSKSSKSRSSSSKSSKSSKTRTNPARRRCCRSRFSTMRANKKAPRRIPYPKKMKSNSSGSKRTRSGRKY